MASAQSTTAARAGALRAAAVAIAPFGVLALYLLTLTDVHTFDALSYVTSVERKPWTELFHPHHLAYGPLGALAHALAQALGYAGGAERPLQLVNALAGALGVALLHRCVRRDTGRDDVALAAAALLATGYAFWYYAVEIEVYTLAAVFLIICLDLLVRQGPWGRGRLVALGLAHAGATLFHQTNVLLAVPIGVCALLDLLSAEPRAETPRPGAAALGRWLARWAWYALSYALAVGLPYLYAIVVVSGFRTPDAALAWLTEYARTGWWGGVGGDTPGRLAQGLAETLTLAGGGWAWLALGLLALPWERLRGADRRPQTTDRRPQAQPTSAGASGASLLRSIAHGPRSAVAALLAWLVVYGAFFGWWEPDNIEFWIASLPPLLLLLARGLAAGRPWSWRPIGALGVAAALGVANYGAIDRRGDAATDLQRVVARELAARSTPADLLVIPDGLQELYLPHYERRENFISLNQALFDAGGDLGAACAAIRGRIEVALHAGATALVAEEALRPPDELLARHGLARAAAEACLAPYLPELVALELPSPIPAYWRLPYADERAAGDGWSFARAADGWSAANVSDARFDGGWRFRAGDDPALTSPLLSIDAAAYDAVEIRMASRAAARDAQLFFAGPDGAIAEERSVRWQIAEGGAATTYRLELRDAPGWQGRIGQLRLDPVGVGGGAELRVEWIRLIRAGP